MTQDEFRNGADEYNDEQLQLWDEVSAKMHYWKFTDNNRHKITISKWQLSKKLVPDFHDKDINVERIEFRAMFTIDFQEYEFSTLSSRFICAVKPFLYDLNPLSDVITLKIKRVGEGNAVQYDVEPLE